MNSAANLISSIAKLIAVSALLWVIWHGVAIYHIGARDETRTEIAINH